MMLMFAACIKHLVWPWCLPLLLFIGGQYFHQSTMKLYFYLPYLSSLEAFNPLNTELNPICHLLALLEAHHILHISRIRVNSDYMCRK